jgi:hypothetical protein
MDNSIHDGGLMSNPILMRADGTLPVEDEVWGVLRTAIRGSGMNMEAIAAEMTKLLGRKITKSMLADFTRNASDKRQPRFPLPWVPAFSIVTKDKTLARFALDAEDKQLLQFGERSKKFEAACGALKEELAAVIAEKRAHGKKLFQFAAKFRKARRRRVKPKHRK